MNGLTNYVSCSVLWLGLAVKAPDLVRHRHDPYLRAICAVLGLAGLCFFLGAPPTIGAVNRLSGVANLAAPLTYAAITAYGAASQVLIVRWRGGPDVTRTARRWITAYTGVIVGIGAAFALGDAPVERRTDLDTYYATTPFIAEMIVLYLVAHLIAASVTMVSALRWARQVTGWLRAGLLTLGVGTLGSAGFSAAKLVAVAARWSGRDWSALDTAVSPAAAGLGALLTSIGILVPLTGPRLAQWRRAGRAYARLAPLERELDDVLTRRALRLPRPRWASPPTRLMWRQTSIHNALGHLDSAYDPLLYADTYAAALHTDGDPSQAEATAWAAVIAAAAHQDRRPHPPTDPAQQPTATGTPVPRTEGAPLPGPGGTPPPGADGAQLVSPVGAPLLDAAETPRLGAVGRQYPEPGGTPLPADPAQQPTATGTLPDPARAAGAPPLPLPASAPLPGVTGTRLPGPAGTPSPGLASAPLPCPAGAPAPSPGAVSAARQVSVGHGGGRAVLPVGGPVDLGRVADALVSSPLVAAARAVNGVRPV
ncbi:MAB_1171c family putative transporter [Streptomyces sp. Ru71]|uniref:MAB_1171c family putative transporter n=1 Tax=Streptomyces sp. Ru71 TaxID=2080746 RepID=UPI00268BD9A0|nr:MAB_1171c family putative transporter [Streptomyces sp. Ru71]